MLVDSGEINSQSPEPRSESGDELCTPQGGLCNQGVFAVDSSQVVRKTSQLQRNKLVQSFHSSPLQTVVAVTGNLAGPSWKSVTLLSLQKAACGPQSREFKANSRHTVNPRKIATLAPTIV
jgi:hypothetical protein